MLCTKQQQLLEDICVASSRYYEATSRLVALAGRSTPMNFSDTKDECSARLQDCRHAKTAMRDHRADHGC